MIGLLFMNEAREYKNGFLIKTITRQVFIPDGVKEDNSDFRFPQSSWGFERKDMALITEGWQKKGNEYHRTIVAEY